MLLALVLSVVLQQHPCDITNPTSYHVVASKLLTTKIGFCFAKDNPVEPTRFSLQINSGPDIDLGILHPQTGPNAKGQQYYETYAALTAGELSVKAYTSQGISPASNPVTLTLKGKP